MIEALLEAKVVAIAYETVQKDNGSLSLLAPMSEIAGRIAPLAGSFYLAKYWGGCGKLLGGASAVSPATSTLALTGATFPYVLRIAERGPENALRYEKMFLLSGEQIQ